MDSLDSEVLARLREWLRQGRDGWLCTIVATYGSSPRPVGSLLAYDGAGESAGSLSGGCVEDELLQRLAAGDVEAPQRLAYGVTRADSERLGLPCGGTLEVLVERLPAASARYAEQLDEIMAALQARHCLERRVDLASGEWTLQPSAAAAPLYCDERELRQSLGPGYQLLLVGAGELARWLARFALALDYRVLVTDPRPEVLGRWDIPGVECIGGMPDDAVRAHANDSHSIVITLTHDPRIDDMALLEALPGLACYVGALGSRRTSEQRRQRLRQLDLPEASIQRLHAPVGLDIGSKRPPEIAIAILAELTRLRAEREGARG